MNSVVQSLSFTSLFTNYLLSKEFIKNSDSIIINEFWNLLCLLNCGKYRLITPIPFKQIIGHMKHFYLRNEQQDTHEFLIFLLDYFRNEMNNSIITDLFEVCKIIIYIFS